MVNNWFWAVQLTPLSLFTTAYNVGTDGSAYDMMLGTVEEYIDDSNYFSIEFKSKFSAYDIQPELPEKAKMSGESRWKHFFSETYAE
jgi:hypothetical protein